MRTVYLKAATRRSVVVSASATAVPRSTEQPHRLKVVTYNILANKYATCGWHSHCSPEYLDWTYRRALILEELQHYDSDIICLQEVECDVFRKELQPWLKPLGYEGWYLARQRPETSLGPPEGVALFVRTTGESATFEVEEVHSVHFSSPDPADRSTPVLPSSLSSQPLQPHEELQQQQQRHQDQQQQWEQQQWEQQQQREEADLPVACQEALAMFRRRQEGAVMALLRHRATGTRLLAACTHLYWNPRYAGVKALQAAALCRRAAALLRERFGEAGAAEVPVVIGGDFNSLWRKYVPDVFEPKIPSPPGYVTSGVYELLSGGSLGMEHKDHPAHDTAANGSSSTSSSANTSASSGGSSGSGNGSNGGNVGKSGSVNGDPMLQEVHGGVEHDQLLLATQPLTTSGLQLGSVNMLAHGSEPLLTTRTSKFAGCLDYIWVTPAHLQVDATLSLPYEVVGSTNGTAVPHDPLRDVPFPAIPNQQYPSDHLAVACVLQLTPSGSNTRQQQGSTVQQQQPRSSTAMQAAVL